MFLFCSPGGPSSKAPPVPPRSMLSLAALAAIATRALDSSSQASIVAAARRSRVRERQSSQRLREAASVPSGQLAGIVPDDVFRDTAIREGLASNLQEMERRRAEEQAIWAASEHDAAFAAARAALSRQSWPLSARQWPARGRGCPRGDRRVRTSPTLHRVVVGLLHGASSPNLLGTLPRGALASTSRCTVSCSARSSTARRCSAAMCCTPPLRRASVQPRARWSATLSSALHGSGRGSGADRLLLRVGELSLAAPQNCSPRSPPSFTAHPHIGELLGPPPSPIASTAASHLPTVWALFSREVESVN